MKEKLQEFALVAEIISALAVVAGLIFVGLEISQSTDQAALNTRALETAAYQDLIGQILDINNTYNADLVLDDIVARGNAGELTDPGEFNIYTGYAITVTRHADMACFQYQQGILSEDRLASAYAIFINQIYHGQQNIQQGLEPVISIMPGFQDCIDKVLPYYEQNRRPSFEQD